MTKFIFPFIDEDTDLIEYQVTPWGLAPKTRKRVHRIRHTSLTTAIAQARKAGVMQGTITVNGVSLSFGEERNAKPNGHTIETADELRKLI